MRRATKGLSIFFLTILLILVSYVLYLLPRWVFFTLIGIALVRVGWLLYDC